MEKYDFSGWATKNDLKCSDGRIIRKDAFKHNDGQTVPLVWNHDHTDPYRIVGHALLENREDGVYAYCSLNDTDLGQTAKIYVQHGDINQLSIYANQLKQQGPNVMHGAIREVSLVMAGANPGACIENVMIHGEESDEEGVIYTGEDIYLYHADNSETKKDSKKSKENKEDKNMPENEKTIKDIYDEMTEEQQTAVQAMIGMALDEDDVDDEDYYDEDDYYDEENEEMNHSEGGNYYMKHNVFDQDEFVNDNVLSHADQESILKMAKNSNVGTLQSAIQIFTDDNNLQHDALAGGFIQTGTGNVTELFPEYKDVRPGAPELVTNDQGWVSVVMNKVHKSPISRIRTSYVDIRNLETLRAKGYAKGKEKQLTGTIALAKRTTDPQTIYVKNALHRDDIVDITDFDYVQYLYKIDRMMLNEELATAIMIGDGRDVGDEDKIAEDKIRPIWKDDEVYTLHVDLDIEKAKSELQGSGTGVSFGENYITAEAMANTILHAKEKYKGSGTPDLYITPHMLNVMLLARDMNGRRIYASKAELASTLSVGNIYTAEQFAGKTRTDGEGNTKKLLALLVNLNDYSLGATKGGEVTHFTQFDIDFNQQKSLLETRCSGALTKLASAIAIEEPSEVAAG